MLVLKPRNNEIAKFGRICDITLVAKRVIPLDDLLLCVDRPKHPVALFHMDGKQDQVKVKRRLAMSSEMLLQMTKDNKGETQQ